MTCWLCPAHHNMSNAGVHFNKALDLHLKQQAEKIWVKEFTNDSLPMEDRIA